MQLHQRLLRIVPFLALVLAPAAAQCPGWDARFALPGVDGSVAALAWFDDGSGPALYAGGSFRAAGGVPAKNVARWNGTSWSALGNGLGNDPSHSVRALAVFDDGTGPALYAGGVFAQGWWWNLARWNGTSWSLVGGPVVPFSADFDVSVEALHVFDDGSGPALYVAGQFGAVAGVPAANLARWNGTSWSAVGSGFPYYDNVVSALAVHDDGSGPALYAADYAVHRWNGAAWTSLAGGMNERVLALASYDDGTGPALYAGGLFTTVGGSPANHIVRWSGAAWSPLGAGIGIGGTYSAVASLEVFDDGGGPSLAVGGRFSTAGGVSALGIARWNGSWSPLAAGLSGDPNAGVGAFVRAPAGLGVALIAGGGFSASAGSARDGIAAWDGAAWSALGTGAGLRSAVRCLAHFDDGTGPALYAGGTLTAAGDIAVEGIARWSGTSWSPLGGGVSLQFPGYSTSVNALEVFDDGTGRALFAGGQFQSAGGAPAANVARWNGTSWSPLGAGIGSDAYAHVDAFVIFDDGGGPALWAGGNFGSAGGASAGGIARWNGTGWFAPPGFVGAVQSLEVFDDGIGPALYAGGLWFTIGGTFVSPIVKWNGTSWTQVGGPLTYLGYSSAQVRALRTYDDGTGSALYVGGTFTTAGSLSVRSIVRWSGSAWSAVGNGLEGWVHALQAFDDGTGAGPSLYAGGSFGYSGSTPMNILARWDGSSWSPVAGGIGGTHDASAVGSLHVFDDGAGGGPDLYVGGSFAVAGGQCSAALAELHGCGITGTFVCAGDGSGAACPCGNEAPVGTHVGCLDSLGRGGALVGSGNASVAADTLVLAGSGMTNSACLYYQGSLLLNGGLGTPFGDGLRCAGGSIVRLAIAQNTGGASHYPGPGDPPVSVRGAVSAGATLTYQVWFRDAAAWCTSATFNLTNGLQVAWQ